jgi:hypothetical protein
MGKRAMHFVMRVVVMQVSGWPTMARQLYFGFYFRGVWVMHLFMRVRLMAHKNGILTIG